MANAAPVHEAKPQLIKIMTSHFFIATTDLTTALGKVIGILQALSMVIMVGALIIAGVSVASGRIEYIKHSILGAALAALAWVLVHTLFSSIGGSVIIIDPQPM